LIHFYKRFRLNPSMGTPTCTSELDHYVSLLCSHSLPDRFTEMKIIKQLIDQGKIPLLKDVIRRVLAVSRNVKRTTVFQRLAEKWQFVRPLVTNSKETSNSLEETTSQRTVLKDNIITNLEKRTSCHSKEESPESLPCKQTKSSSNAASLSFVDLVPIKVEAKKLEDEINEKSMRFESEYLKVQFVNESQIDKIKRKRTKRLIFRKSLSGQKTFVLKCEVCNRSFVSASAVELHKRQAHRIVKSGLKIFEKKKPQVRKSQVSLPCGECGQKYESVTSLEKHVERVHNAKSTVPCPENCGKMLTSKRSIKKHLLSHRPHSEWPVGCPLCKRRFQARSDLSKHLHRRSHRQDNLPEFGSDKFRALVYWDRPEKKPKLG